MTTVKFARKPLQRDLNTFFDEILNEFPVKWGRDWNGHSLPPVNIHETADAMHIELNAPGLNKEDFAINVEDGTLSISFEKKEVAESNDYKTVKREFSVQSFRRSFNLGEQIEAENIQAKYENGILKLHLPKKPAAKETVKQINVQ